MKPFFKLVRHLFYVLVACSESFGDFYEAWLVIEGFLGDCQHK